jgi:2-iminobutanoate/2-iminopropanoate deaminase
VGYKNPKTGDEVKGLEAQTRQCLDNIKDILAAAGATLGDIVKVNIYLKNAEDFDRMNEVYRSYFETWPARCTVVPGLANPKMLIEIECIAYCP